MALDSKPSIERFESFPVCHQPEDMTQADQQDAFMEDLDKLIQRYIDKFDLTLASCIGVLEIVKGRVLMDQTGVAYLDEEEGYE